MIALVGKYENKESTKILQENCGNQWKEMKRNIRVHISTDEIEENFS